MSYSCGENTLKVSAKLFAENRARLVAALKNVAPGSVVLLQGGIEKHRYNTDSEDLPFRQKKYEVDEVHFLDGNTISDYLKGIKAKEVWLLKAENSDSGNVLPPA
ncbi:hypothetical protein OSTOST_23021 [Ostertagia ostertagi]